MLIVITVTVLVTIGIKHKSSTRKANEAYSQIVGDTKSQIVEDSNYVRVEYNTITQRLAAKDEEGGIVFTTELNGEAFDILKARLKKECTFKKERNSTWVGTRNSP